MKSVWCFVYGNLRTEGTEYKQFQLKDKAKFLGEIKIEGYALYLDEDLDPYAVHDKQGIISGEVLIIEDSTFRHIKIWKFINGFDLVPDEDLMIFLRMKHPTGKITKVESGIWKTK